MTTRVAFVQCGDAKQEDLEDDETVPAKELYTSTYFIQKRKVAEQLCDEWYIISGEYGLVHPDEPLPHYDTNITEADDEAIHWWHADISAAFATRGLCDRATVEYVVLVGSSYLDLETEYSDRTLREIVAQLPGDARYPFEGLGGMFGQQEWMSDAVDAGELVDPDPEVYA